MPPTAAPSTQSSWIHTEAAVAPGALTPGAIFQPPERRAQEIGVTDIESSWWCAAPAALTLAAWPGTAAACPSCYTGQLARARVLGEHFWHDLVIVLLPVVILAGLAMLLYRIGLPHERAAGVRRPARRRRWEP
jgi:hypothetical protein